MVIEAKYSRSIKAELDALIESSKNKTIECIEMDAQSFDLLVKEIGGKLIYNKMTNSPDLKYKDIPIVKRA